MSRSSIPALRSAVHHASTLLRLQACGATMGISRTFSSAAAEKEMDAPKVVIFGGRGFVGSHIVQEALDEGLRVVSITRSGTPPVNREGWVGKVEWARGNALEPQSYMHHLQGASAVISAVGAFGSQQEMLRTNGTANVTAIEKAKEAGVPRFVFISANIPNIPGIDKLLQGYVKGKRMAEDALMQHFPNTGVALRPGVIYGERVVSSSLTLPLQYLFKPIESGLERLPNVRKLADLPIVGAAFIPPVDVKVVAKAAVKAATDSSIPGGIMGVWEIAKYK